MKAALFLVLLAFAPAARAADSNPLGKVLDLMADLKAKIIKEGEAEAKAFKEYFEWCDDVSKNGENSIKTATDTKAKLEAKIDKLTGSISASDSKIEQLVADIATDSKELEEATAVREKENADFAASEKEMMDALDSLGRAIGIISKEMSKNPASFAQVDSSNMQGLIAVMSSVLDAAAFSSTDQKKLVALVQNQQTAQSDDAELGAPSSATYKSHSTGILDVLEDMKDKAESQLADLRKAETNSKHNYDMLKQSLDDEIAADNTDLAQEKESKASDSEAKATAEGDLEMTTKELAQSKDDLANARTNCMTAAADHEATMTARTEELAAISKAQEILNETSGGAVSQTYSLLQVATSSRLSSRADLKRSEVITLVKRLAQQHHSAALAQLASKIGAVVKMGAASGANPFGKIKGLIEDMIAKLEKEMAGEATEKAYCDEEMTKTEAKKSELEAETAKLSAKIDQAAATSAELKADVKELEAELAALAKEQAEMDKMRSEQNADFTVAKEDLELGLSGVKKALTVLRDYYGGAAMIQNGADFSAFMQQPAKPEAHAAATGAGQSIIGILEVCESDFASNLAKETTEEENAASEYEKTTQENELSKTAKNQDVKYKTQEAKSLDKSIAELSGDRETTNTELSAVLEYYSKIKERCVAKPESYEERKTRRAAEIEGLKEALSILEDETAFVQRKARGNMRGSIAL